MGRLPGKGYDDRHYECDPNSGCWLWLQALSNRGYGKVGVATGCTGSRTESAHRGAYRKAKGPIPPGLFVLHRCDTPSCVNPDHLFLGTHKDNMDDMKRKGRSNTLRFIGENHGRSKLTENQVIEIRSSTDTNVALSKKYKVAKTTISEIRRFVRWKHLA